ncbi:GNAT family N-acetyltransferase [Actinocrispum wychmicini]|uniref:RimJ/RimL family protein N-acetyltransferase n=1 Tax=Actinocrispum wychmicini TaxID=1213861 RepID=A0A4R2JZ53_9PSEU|nr:GNAT family protein [Actinocrispum wychmicini]TCO62706.1 RimJ/RimL family protein N-acetyltransferase [Actinocrispum wychmicini]
MYPVRLSGQKVALREWRDDDVDDALRVFGDERVTRWLSFDNKSRDQVSQMVSDTVQRAGEAERKEYYLAVTSRDTGGLIGFARLGLSGVQAADLGYAIAADEWGKGYASDATHSLIDFGFSELGLHRISAAIGPENVASIAVVRRLGFVEEGRLRDHVHTNGAWRDSVLYSLLVDEWRRG